MASKNISLTARGNTEINLSIGENAKKIIQSDGETPIITYSATGQKGDKGAKGAKGSKGPKGDSA